MKKQQIGLFILFLNAFTLLAQHTDIGMHIKTIQLNNTENYGISNGATHDYENHNYTADVFIERINFKDILYRATAGIHKFSSTSNDYYNYSTGSSESNSKAFFTEYFFSLGIGKYYDLEKVAFKIGLEIPFHFRGIQYRIYDYVNYDSTGNKMGSRKNTYEEPAILFVGVFFFTNVYYNFWKSFSVGIEVTNGFLYSRGKGPASEVLETYDANGNLTNKETTEEELKRKGFNTSFLNPSVGLSYRF